jgi:hypothetical protein
MPTMPETRQKQEPRPRGRPALPPDQGKRHPFNLRTTKELRDQLQTAADGSGRSLAQEIERRLEQSFDDVLDAGFTRNAGVLLMIARILRDASIYAAIVGSPDWLDDGGDFEAVRAAINTAMLTLRPQWPSGDNYRSARYALVASIAARTHSKIRDRLGPELVGRIEAAAATADGGEEGR